MNGRKETSPDGRFSPNGRFSPDVDGFPGFRARLPWLGGDLQTLHNVLLGRYADLSAWPERRLELPLADGSGDRLSAVLHRPAEARRRPLAVLIHGLTGCEDSSYIRATARHLLGQGLSVLRLNLRGAGPGQELCRFRYHAGRSEDLRDALGALDAAGDDLLGRGLVLVGYSLGGNILLKFLAEYGREFPVLAAVSVSAPIDLKATQVRIMAPRNLLYHRYLLARMKREATEGAREQPEAERAAVQGLRSLFDFDDRLVAPCNGFAGAEDYYRRCSARAFLPEIEVPTLVIHALTDPWVPSASYLDVDWGANPHLVPLLSPGGGHVGFHGHGSRTAWHDRCIAQFVSLQTA